MTRAWKILRKEKSYDKKTFIHTSRQQFTRNFIYIEKNQEFFHSRIFSSIRWSDGRVPACGFRWFIALADADIDSCCGFRSQIPSYVKAKRTSDASQHFHSTKSDFFEQT